MAPVSLDDVHRIELQQRKAEEALGKMRSLERSGAGLGGREVHGEQRAHDEERTRAVYVFCNVFGSESTPYTVHACCASKRLLAELCILKAMSRHGHPHAVPCSPARVPSIPAACG